MGSAMIDMDTSEFDRVADAIRVFGENADREISLYLEEEGGKGIMKEIARLIPVSGRKWKEKKTAASLAASGNPSRVFKQKVAKTSVTVSTKKAYNYLYFPDDGSNTRHHAGMQKFMLRGAENAKEKMINEIVERLVVKFEEGE